MKTMTLRLNDKEYEQLCTLAHAEGRSMADVIHEAIGEYIQRKAPHHEFRTLLEKAMQENTQLIAELAKPGEDALTGFHQNGADRDY